MADETNVIEAAEIDEVADEAVEEIEETDEAVEKAVSVSEVPVDELDFVKMVDDLNRDLNETINKNYADVTSATTDVQKSVDDFGLDIKKSIDDFGAKMTELSNNVAEVTKRLDAIESATAVKKSDSVEAPKSDNTKIAKSIWQGHFLGVQDL